MRYNLETSLNALYVLWVYFNRQGWIKNMLVIIIVSFFLVINRDLDENFRDCLNSCIKLFFNEKRC